MLKMMSVLRIFFISYEIILIPLFEFNYYDLNIYFFYYYYYWLIL